MNDSATKPLFWCAIIAQVVGAQVFFWDHWKRSQFVLWKAMLLVSAIFAFFCYKRQLASVGDALLETQPEHAEKTTIELKETGKL